MKREEIANRARKYVRENFLYARPNYEFSDTDSLLMLGIIDSMGVAELVAFIEDEFAVELDDDDITEENLGSVEGIAGFVFAKCANRVAAPVSRMA